MSRFKKIFVGNVPFDCSQKLFTETFKDVEGFVRGDIVTRPRSDICRGFGFVTINNVDNAEKLKKRKDLYIKSRQLRFTNYIVNDTHKSKYIYIDNIPSGKKRNYLKDTFKGNSIGKYFISTDINTGIPRHHGLIEMLDADEYFKLLESGYAEDNDNNILKLSKWKGRNSRKRHSDLTKYDIVKAFAAGRSVGIMEGREMTTHKITDK
jgi:hypothetical protein